VNQSTNLEIGRSDEARVLLVDDEPLVLEGLRRSLHTEFVADLAEGPEEGLAKLRKDGPYPVVVSDMRMPGMDGVEFLATVRTIAPDSIRMMLTGSSDMEVATRAVNEGQIFRFLTKPVTPETLLATLRAGLAQYHAARLEKEQLKNN
jgi:DNA-binding NtrC family response regulator